jgi:hypothetical protein
VVARPPNRTLSAFTGGVLARHLCWWLIRLKRTHDTSTKSKSSISVLTFGSNSDLIPLGFFRKNCPCDGAVCQTIATNQGPCGTGASAPAPTPTIYLLSPDVVDGENTSMMRRVGQVAKDDQPVLTQEHPWENAIFLCGL